MVIAPVGVHFTTSNIKQLRITYERPRLVSRQAGSTSPKFELPEKCVSVLKLSVPLKNGLAVLNSFAAGRETKRRRLRVVVWAYNMNANTLEFDT